MIKIATGEAGLEMLHNMIAQEASQFQYVDTLHIRDTQSPYHEYSKEYGKLIAAQYSNVLMIIPEKSWNPEMEIRGED